MAWFALITNFKASLPNLVGLNIFLIAFPTTQQLFIMASHVCSRLVSSIVEWVCFEVTLRTPELNPPTLRKKAFQ